jgi:hypothetical protein
MFHHANLFRTRLLFDPRHFHKLESREVHVQILGSHVLFNFISAVEIFSLGRPISCEIAARGAAVSPLLTNPAIGQRNQQIIFVAK